MICPCIIFQQLRQSPVTHDRRIKAVGTLSDGLKQALDEALATQTEQLEQFLRDQMQEQTQELKHTVQDSVEKGAEKVIEAVEKLQPQLDVIQAELKKHSTQDVS